MIANLVTLVRIPILAVAVLLLYRPEPAPRYLGTSLILLALLLDTVDGIIARRMNQTSMLGSILDIAADRALELVLWIVFADLGLIPLIVPLIVVTRGVFVDAFRAAAPAYGIAPFDLMRSRLGRFLVKSSWLRMSYSITKITAFFLLALQHSLTVSTAHLPDGLRIAGQVATWSAVGLCLVRGIPVLVEAPRVLFSTVTSEKGSTT
ncbi:MAG: CDP-alcohol phosphatidyltransferase family protein [Anaerolineae bacterium]